METPKVEKKEEEQPVQPVATPETPEESVEDQTPSVVDGALLLTDSIDNKFDIRRDYCSRRPS